MATYNFCFFGAENSRYGWRRLRCDDIYTIQPGIMGNMVCLYASSPVRCHCCLFKKKKKLYVTACEKCFEYATGGSSSRTRTCAFVRTICQYFNVFMDEEFHWKVQSDQDFLSRMIIYELCSRANKHDSHLKLN